MGFSFVRWLLKALMWAAFFKETGGSMENVLYEY